MNVSDDGELIIKNNRFTIARLPSITFDYGLFGKIKCQIINSVTVDSCRNFSHMQHAYPTDKFSTIKANVILRTCAVQMCENASPHSSPLI